MANSFQLVIVSPDQQLVDESVEYVYLQSVEGGMEIFYDHAPTVVVLDIGPLKYRKDGEEKIIAVSGGFAEITGDVVRVISDAAESPEDIDLQRAIEAKERAEERLSSKQKDTNVLRAELALRRSLLRMQIGDKNNRNK